MLTAVLSRALLYRITIADIAIVKDKTPQIDTSVHANWLLFFAAVLFLRPSLLSWQPFAPSCWFAWQRSLHSRERAEPY
jgi:hypothetical protein